MLGGPRHPRHGRLDDVDGLGDHRRGSAVALTTLASAVALLGELSQHAVRMLGQEPPAESEQNGSDVLRVGDLRQDLWEKRHDEAAEHRSADPAYALEH